jgi:chitin disaccharide deacetylase
MRSLIINADDFGFSPEINAGSLHAFTHGIVTDTTLLIHSPYARPAIEQAGEVGLPVGLHLDFVTECAQRHYPHRSHYLGPQGALATELYNREFGGRAPQLFTCEALITFRDVMRDQIDQFSRLAGEKPTHLDYHFFLHYLPEVMAIYILVAEEYKIPVRWGEQYAGRNSYPRAPRRFHDRFRGTAETSVKTFAAYLDSQWSGTLEICCHPGLFTPCGLPDGYNREREFELRVLTDPQLRQEIHRRGIQLVNYRWLPPVS